MALRLQSQDDARAAKRRIAARGEKRQSTFELTTAFSGERAGVLETNLACHSRNPVQGIMKQMTIANRIRCARVGRGRSGFAFAARNWLIGTFR